MKENFMSPYQSESPKNPTQPRKLETAIFADTKQLNYAGQIKITAKVFLEKGTSNVGSAKYQVIAASRPRATAKKVSHFRLLDSSTRKHVKLDGGLSREETESYIQSQLEPCKSTILTK